MRSKRVGQTGLCLLLSAMVLIGNMLPGIQHSHAGGNNPRHRHDGTAITYLETSHDEPTAFHHHHRHDPLDRGLVVSDFLADEDSHLHFQWFGFQVALPDTKVPAQERKAADNGRLVYLRPSEEIVVPSPLKLGLEKPVADPGHWLPVDGALSDSTVIVLQKMVKATFLCETARHERSGVQLT